MIVDIHAHIFPRSALEAYRAGRSWHGFSFSAGPSLSTESGPYSWNGKYWDTASTRLSVMATAGVDVQVLSVTAPLYGYQLEPPDALAAAREVNDELVDTVAANPDHFYGLASLPLQDVSVAIDELERAMGLGLVGASIGTTVAGRQWDDPMLHRFLEAADQMKALLLLHPWAPDRTPIVRSPYLANTIGNPLEITAAAVRMMLSGILDRLPNLRMCLAQGGGYIAASASRLDYALAKMRKERRGRLPSEYARQLYFDSLTYDHGELKHLVRLVGAEHVLLGSDYPSTTSLANPVEWLSECGLDRADEARILGQNANTLLHG